MQSIMAEEYDVQAIMDALREKEEMDPDQHDGSYELMRETIEAGLAIFPLFTIDDSSNSNKFVVQK